MPSFRARSRVNGPQVHLLDEGRYFPTKSVAGILIEAEMDAAVDARVRHVGKDLAKRRVAQYHAGECWADANFDTLRGDSHFQDLVARIGLPVRR
jgi:hypothetical protein